MKRRDFMSVSSSAFVLSSIAPGLAALKAAAVPVAATPPPHWNPGGNLSAAHTRIANAVGPNNLAVGVRLAWLNDYFERDLGLVQSLSKPFPTSLNNLSVQLIMAPKALTVGQDAATHQPTISGKISLSFMPSDSLTTPYRTRDVVYSDTKLRLISDPLASGEFILSLDGSPNTTIQSA